MSLSAFLIAIAPWGFILLGLFCMWFNWVLLLREYKIVKTPPGTPYMSYLPFFGGALAGIGLAFNPILELRHWWWLPTLLDPGGLMQAWFEMVVRFVRRVRGLREK